jgi:hypothetical protein
VLPAVIAAATGGLSPSVPAEPLKAAVAAHSLRGAGPNGWNLSAATLITDGSRGGKSQVASAIRRLDLSKLTMADFGDVDQSR